MTAMVSTAIVPMIYQPDRHSTKGAKGNTHHSGWSDRAEGPTEGLPIPW